MSSRFAPPLLVHLLFLPHVLPVSLYVPPTHFLPSFRSKLKSLSRHNTAAGYHLKKWSHSPFLKKVVLSIYYFVSVPQFPLLPPILFLDILLIYQENRNWHIWYLFQLLFLPLQHSLYFNLFSPHSRPRRSNFLPILLFFPWWNKNRTYFL